VTPMRCIRAAVFPVGVSTLAVCACLHAPEWPAPPPVSAQTAASSSAAVAALSAPSYGPHPRLLVTPDRLAAVRGLRAAGAAPWKTLAAHCDEDAGPPIASGYQGWDWANAVLDLAICNAVAPREDYARGAIRYFQALLDDRFKVGDGAGGDDVVRHDDGYPIRTHGCLGALAFDWLHDAPGMTDELRKHALDRFGAWSSWFSETGYNRDEPISNYYMGWFGAVAFAGIAAHGDDPRGATMVADASRMFSTQIEPAYGKKLLGGDFPEGWQYGDLVGSVIAIFVDAQARAGGHPTFGELPWLESLVAYRASALWPDGKHTFDTGDWSEKPAVAPEHAVAILATVLPASSEVSRRARGLARLARDPNEECHWLDVLSVDPSRPAIDPRGGPISHLAPGTGAVTARTDWSAGAVWFAMTSAPSIADHQHLDAGHFEVVRGADALLVDAGGYGSYASLSHNVISVDDHKENDNYAPNQGTFGHDAHVARFEDGGRFVYALADYASAYDPSGFPENHPRRSVMRAEREVVFSRSPTPGLPPESVRIAIYDRITLGKPTYQAAFLMHGGGAPDLRGGSVRFAVGHSSALMTTLLPRDVAPVVVREPTDFGAGPFFANEPPEGQTSVRIEVRSRPGDTERRFFHVVVASTLDANAPAPQSIEGDVVDGVAVADEAYVFARAAPQVRAAPEAYKAPLSATHHLIASLAPGATYAVTAQRDGSDCHVALRPGDGIRASDAGTIPLDLGTGCALTLPGSSPRAASAR
jgi:hypothetical protein